MADQHTPSPLPQTREPSVMLTDLTSDLLWPKLLRAPALALNPTRMITGIVAAFILTILTRIPTLWIQQPTSIFPSSTGTAPSLNPLHAFDGLVGFLATIFVTAYAHPWTTLIIGVPMMLVLAIFGCIISRSAAIEFSQGRLADHPDITRFVVRRVSQIATATLAPLVLAALLIGLLALGGFLISAPIIDMLGGLFYAFGLILGLIVTLILVMQFLAMPLIVPAIACEGTDGFDAIQRSYAYITGRPLRVFLFAAILFILATIAFGVFQFIMTGSIALTDWSIALLANDAGARVLSGQGDLGATQPTAHNLIEFWRALFQLAFAGYAISFFYTASTMLYLVTRRVCDGQDIGEIWSDPTD